MITVRVAKCYGLEWTFNYGTDQQLCSGDDFKACYSTTFSVCFNIPSGSFKVMYSFMYVSQSAIVYVNYSLIQKTNLQ